MRFLHLLQRLSARKELADLQAQADASELKRALGGVELIGFGIGGIIGTGIFVLTGCAAANSAGPAIVLSFVIGGMAAALAALAYAELASMIPIAGSAYTYTYATMGEFVAWIIGWDLILEYLVGAATVSVGWSRYLVRLLENVFGLMPKALTESPVIFNVTTQEFVVTGHWFNLPAVCIVLAVTTLLVFGIKGSARVNAAAVVIKLFVILLFIFACCGYVKKENYTPWIPERRDGKYGILGIFNGARTVFFAYTGFDAVSTAAQEAKNPQRDMPIGIIGSLAICTVLYIGVCVVLTGIAHYTTLGTATPLADAIVHNLHWQWLAIMVEIGAIAGMTSVILINLYGQSRIFYIMAADGLFPKWVAKVHPKYRTPYVTTIITGIVCTLAGGLLPIDVLEEIASTGSLFAFVLVNIGVIILRVKQPHAPRMFKVPGGTIGGFLIPAIGATTSTGLIAMNEAPTIFRWFGWMAIGILIYFAYGYRHSRLRLLAKDRESNRTSMPFGNIMAPVDLIKDKD